MPDLTPVRRTPRSDRMRASRAFRPSTPSPRALRSWTRLVAVGGLALALGMVALPAEAGGHSRPGSGGYVALGDSFAAGDGLSPYEAGTASDTNQCRRSVAGSYPVLLAAARPALGKVRSAACSGAITGSLFADLDPSYDEPAQLRALRHDTRTVTLTIGGNDVGFAPVLADCIHVPLPDPALQGLVPGRPGCAARNDAAVSAAIDQLAGRGRPGAALPRVRLAVVLAAIQARAPRATIYVTGYPALFGAAAGPAGCPVGAIPTPQGEIPLAVTAADAAWIAEKAGDLDAAIREGVARARRLGVHAHYVDVRDPFAGHNVCDTDQPWLNAVLLDPAASPPLSPASFHPTAAGQEAYATAVRAALARHDRR